MPEVRAGWEDVANLPCNPAGYAVSFFSFDYFCAHTHRRDCPVMRSLTVWGFETRVDRVWQALADPMSWPQWWPGLVRVVELSPGDAIGVGAVRRFTWRGLLPYRLCFVMRTTALIPCELASGQASGDLEGVGDWRFFQQGPQTVVRYEWRVRLVPLWLRALGAVSGPVLDWSHDAVMCAGGQGLAARLGVPFLGCTCSRLPA